MSLCPSLRAAALRPAVRCAVMLAASGLALEPGAARACSCAGPTGDELRVGDGRIPSNAAGVTWWFAGGLSAPGSLVTLERWQGQQLERVDAVVESSPGAIYLIRPARRWSEGERYRVTIDAGPNLLGEGRFRSAEFEVSEPLEGGELTLVQQAPSIRQQLAVAYFAGSGCGGPTDTAFVDVAVSSTTQALPLGILFFETYVDGQLWHPREGLCNTVEPGSSWVGRGRDRLVALCSLRPEPGLSLGAGVHRVRMEARLPGTDVRFRSDEQSVVLSCEDDSRATASGSVSEGMAPAAGTLPVAGQVVVGEAETREPQDNVESGCALSSSSHERRWRHGALALLALGLLGVRRRRG